VHEVSIVEALIDQVRREVEQLGHHGRVTRLELVIGRLSGVCVDSLRFAFEILAPGTLLERAAVEIAEPRAECRCRPCGKRTPIDEIVVQCPACASPEISIEGGRDLLLQSIELED
jgi:hydrogenase nickel incorporation protein HypA/HybF